MVDPISTGQIRVLRAAEVRFVGLQLACLKYDGVFSQPVPASRRATLYFVAKGAATLEIKQGSDRDKLYLNAGDIAAVEGGHHEWRNIPKAQMSEPSDGCEILVSSVDIKSATVRGLRDGYIIIRASESPFSDSVRQCMLMMHTEHAENQHDDGVNRRLAEICMLQLVRYVRASTIRFDILGKQREYDEHILRVLSAFFVEPKRDWTIEDLAHEAGLSRAALFEKFTRTFGRSPKKLLNRLRLQIASEVLLEGSASLSEAAEHVGYGSAAAFCRAFQREFGESPGAWRARQ